MQWLKTILYGLVSGLTECIPVSSRAHQAILSLLFGFGEAAPLRQMMIHAAVLAALLVSCSRDIARLRRDWRLAKASARSNPRPVDSRSLMTRRLLKTALVPMLAGFLFYRKTDGLTASFPMVAGMLVLNGVFLSIPQRVKSGNKDARTMAPLDGVLIGLAGAISVLPGISRIGMITSVASIRGADKGYGLNVALLLSIPALVVLLLFDAFAVITAMETITLLVFLEYILTAAAAFVGCFCGILTMRSLAIKAGFSGFAYYSWGAALFMMVLYLTT